MIFAIFNANNEITGVATGVTAASEAIAATGGRYESTWDWNAKDVVDDIAAKLTEVTGDLYLAVDGGPHSRPRFSVFKAPKVGDEVSKGFNGDYYPCGKIVAISKTMKKIVTDDGTVFYRRSTTRWLDGGTFVMVRGVHNERNPHF